ncbi:hypothetical protein FA13DRAFT_1517505 [Coprinellus micaceus]|uniref:Uncharacterized protein n=1 Tax=Coprinellus micaceus TaxID=71717 RepID=A0A4Y7SKQ3_COPMI|nr:hypothetical protein FA13DRAFT_1517505 [Coprinellus micaceus]
MEKRGIRSGGAWTPETMRRLPLLCRRADVARLIRSCMGALFPTSAEKEGQGRRHSAFVRSSSHPDGYLGLGATAKPPHGIIKWAPISSELLMVDVIVTRTRIHQHPGLRSSQGVLRARAIEACNLLCPAPLHVTVGQSFKVRRG